VLPVIDPAPAWTAGRGIWVVGDSLTVQTSEPLGVALTLAGWHLQGIDAVNGRKTPVAMARAETLFSVLPAPPVVLVATGTNDYETPYSEQTQRIGAFVNWLLAHGARQIYWVDAHRVGDEEVNRALRDVAATAPTTLHVIAWNDAATQHPSWIVADGVHLTEEGRSGRVSVIMSALPDPLSVPAQ
jgi:hypothetical protein